MKAALLLREIADVRVRQFLAGPAEGSLVQGRAAQRLAKFPFHFGEVIVEGHGFQEMLEPRLLAVSAATALDENPQDSADDLVNFSGRNDDAEVASKSLVASGSAKSDTKDNFLSQL